MADPNEIVEVPRSQLETLQRAGRLLDSLAADRSRWDNPADRLAFMRQVKKDIPSVSIPELDIAEPMLAPVREQIAGLQTQLQGALDREAERTKKDADRDADAGLMKLLDKTQAKYRLNEEGRKLMVDRMRDQGSMDAEAAATFVLHHFHTPDPVGEGTMAPGAVDIFNFNKAAEDDSMRRLHSNPERWFEEETAKMVDAFKRGEAA